MRGVSNAEELPDRNRVEKNPRSKHLETHALALGRCIFQAYIIAYIMSIVKMSDLSLLGSTVSPPHARNNSFRSRYRLLSFGIVKLSN